jgi:acetolactate synthase-1/2/3 large subunit
MLIISGGIRNDLQYQYQLHEMDHHRFMSGLCKSSFLVETHVDVIPTIYEAYRVAMDEEPGPVFVEIPVNIQMMVGGVPEMPDYEPPKPLTVDSLRRQVRQAAEFLRMAKHPAIFAGWGARDARDTLIALAEMLDAPVATTLQGLAVFPGDHPLHTGMGFGPSAVPAAREAFRLCDCLLAVGTRFSEIPTGSFGVKVPENLIHIDINPDVIGANYPVKVPLPGDARLVLDAIVTALGNNAGQERRDGDAIRTEIRDAKTFYRQEWLQHDSKDRINPLAFFDALRASLPTDGIIVADDGNHTFLAAELMPIFNANGFICPTDFNCMGYAVPAAIGAKLTNPDKDVVAIVGDGAFTMTCMEILTASRNKLGVVFYVFHDGELSQIAQAQQLPYNRKSCTVLEGLDVSGVAQATGAAYMKMNEGDELSAIALAARDQARAGRPVIVDVKIDYSRQTAFTRGTVQTNFKRFPVGTQMRFMGRAVYRKVTG